MPRIDVKAILARQAAQRAVAADCICSLTKEDVPAVEAEISLLAPLVADLWRSGAEAAIAAAAAQAALLAGLRDERDREFTQDTILAILLSLFTAFDQQSLEASIALDAGRRLVAAGWESTGETFTGLSADQAVLAASAAEDLHFWLRRRLREREGALVAILTPWAALGPAERVAGLEELLGELSRVVDDPRGVASEFLTDLWAYRTYNAGIVLAALSAGEEVLELFNNPRGGGPDANTTPFCRAIHGTIYSVRRLWKQLTGYYNAVERGDAEGAKEALPLLSTEEAQLKRGGAEAVAERLGLGPPPYHGRCRTVLRVRRQRSGRS